MAKARSYLHRRSHHACQRKHADVTDADPNMDLGTTLWLPRVRADSLERKV
jgi:hypothetical protein